MFFEKKNEGAVITSAWIFENIFRGSLFYEEIHVDFLKLFFQNPLKAST